jgi:hypothetical protein
MSRVKERAAARSITEAVVQGEVTGLLLLLFGACVRSHHKTPFVSVRARRTYALSREFNSQ